MEPKKLTFKELTDNFIRFQLGFIKAKESTVLSNWSELSNKQVIINEDISVLKRYQKILLNNDKWNEFELSEWFIGPIMSLVDFCGDEIKLFAYRELTAIINNYELIGKPDAMIASGIDFPIIPYFCFHEYKRQTDPNGDPRTQLLGAMIVAQALNNDEKPIYGVYIIGYSWTFVVLKDNKWCESNSYSAKDNDIFDIYKMLLALKEIIFNQ